MFADVRQMSELFGPGGLAMGTSTVADCDSKYLRTEGGVKVCADGNATDSWDDPWAKGRKGWGYYDNGFAGPYSCPEDAFCQKVWTSFLFYLRVSRFSEHRMLLLALYFFSILQPYVNGSGTF
jgi:hypothetical protein